MLPTTDLKHKYAIPRSGNEKGSVENKVGYIRYNFFSSTPVMADFKSFNQNLAKQLVDDRERLHYEKQKKIADLWKEEEANLLPLPEIDYPVFKEIQLKSNKYNEVKFDNEWIHVPRLKNHAIIYENLAL